MKSENGFVVGQGVGQFGRWFRLIVGVYFSSLLMLLPFLQGSPPPTDALSFLGQTLLYTLAILIVYIIGFRLLEDSILKLKNPWIPTLVFLGPGSILALAGQWPAPFWASLGLYINISLIVNFAISYGGCEVLAIPSLIFNKRYTVYCPYNAVDAVENSLLVAGSGGLPLALLSTAITLVVGGYFLMVETLGMLRDLGFHADLDNRFALLLLIPIVFLYRNAWLLRRQNGQTSAVRNLLVGATVLTVLTIIFVGGLSYEPFWGIAMFGGGLLGILALAYQRLASGKQAEN